MTNAYAFDTSDGLNCRCVHVTGDVDIRNARELAATMDATAAGGPLVVDLSACTYLDSTGLSVFVKHERAHRGRLVIVAPSGHRSLRIFEIAGLALTLTIVPTLDDAYAAHAHRSTA
ncbi:MAG: hypothetical protein NVS2B3_11570 [Vulcanimicrobiaceae bacterium]